MGQKTEETRENFFTPIFLGEFKRNKKEKFKQKENSP